MNTKVMSSEEALGEFYQADAWNSLGHPRIVDLNGREAITPQRDEWDATDWEDATEAIIRGECRNIYRDKRIISRGYVVE